MSDLRAPDEDAVKGGKEIEKLAQAGLALFAAKAEDEVTLDTAGAEAYKTEMDAKHAALEAEAAALTGKDNKKARTEKSKEASALKTSPEYIDAVRVAKGQPPKNGNFAKKKEVEKPQVEEKPTEEVAAEATTDEKKKDDKPRKKIESAGISKAERDELEKLKNDIIAKKKALKDSGLSGAQCNKDPDVVQMVARMQELKIKEDPSLADADKKKDKDKGKKKKGALSTEEQAELEKLQHELETYRQRLATEFGYGKKDIANDPDFQELQAKVQAMEKRA